MWNSLTRGHSHNHTASSHPSTAAHIKQSQQNGSSGVVPPALLEERCIPHFYLDTLAMCGAPAPSQLPSTALVYNMMVSSQLPKGVLGNIWSLVNRTLPGQLTREEFFSCLALIALAQKGESLSALCGATSLPIPFLQSFTVNTTTSTSVVVEKLNGNSSSGSGTMNGTTASSDGRLMSRIRSSLRPKSATTNGNSNGRAPQPPPPPPFATRATVQTPKGGGDVLIDLTASSSSAPSARESRGTNGIIGGDLLQMAVSANGEANGKANGEPKLFDVCGDLFTPSATTSPPVDEKHQPSVDLAPFVSIWEECLRASDRLLNDVDELFASAPGSVRKEVLVGSQRGSEMARAMGAILGIHRRILFSLEEEDGTSAPTELPNRVQSAVVRLEVFLNDIDVAVDYHPTPSSSPTKPHIRCSICAQPIVNSSCCIQFLSLTYHPQCANFYVNCVSTLLPHT